MVENNQLLKLFTPYNNISFPGIRSDSWDNCGFSIICRIFVFSINQIQNKNLFLKLP